MRQRHSSSNRRGPQSQERRPRINEQIKAPEVLMIADGGEAERLPIADAIARAKAEELDLIEVSPKAVPPVVKIGDFGSYLYQMRKKEKRQKAHSKQSEVKTIRFGFRTDTGDIERQAARSREFLAENHLVKVGIILRGREFTNKEYAIDKLKKFIESLMDAAEVEQPIKKQGNQFIVILKPKR